MKRRKALKNYKITKEKYSAEALENNTVNSQN